MEFRGEEALKYGVDEAIVINYFRYWIGKNKANDKHFYDKHYWTYNSIKGFKQIFYFWSEKQIRRILDSLVNKNVLIKGNYNKATYDRTTWYAFSEESLFLDILPLNQMDLPKRENYICPNGQITFAQKGEPIPISNTINNTINKEKEIYKEKESFRKPTIDEIKDYCEERNNHVDAEKFYYYYESKGWLVGKTKMKNWKAAVITWEKNPNVSAPKKKKSSFFC